MTDLTDVSPLPFKRKAKRVFGYDRAAARFLRELVVYRDWLVFSNRSNHSWLLPFRNDFRRLTKDFASQGIRRFLQERRPDSPCYALGISLLGRSASKHSTIGLETLPGDKDPRTRCHFARALRRLESWPRLRQLADDYPDDEFVQAMLALPHNRNFRQRLARFAEHVDQSHAEEAAHASKMPLWRREAEWEATPPKNASWIRYFLERIRRWVHGNVVP